VTRPGIEAGGTRGESKRCFDSNDELPTVLCLGITLQKIGDDGQLKIQCLSVGTSGPGGQTGCKWRRRGARQTASALDPSPGWMSRLMRRAAFAV